MSFIEFIDVSKNYGQKEVLAGINLRIVEGEFVSVVGYSGSGKSTLIGLACGLLRPSSGKVLIGRKALCDFADGAAIVFQNYSLLPWLSAIENVRLAIEAAFPDWSKEKQKNHAAKYLEMVGLGKAFEKRPNQLSGGMRQRVSIARAFAVEPRVLFLDEPFGALDALTRATLQTELKEMCAKTQVTTLMSTNSLDEAALLSDRVIPLSKGPRATFGPAIPVNEGDEAIHIQAKLIAFLTGKPIAAELLEATA